MAHNMTDDIIEEAEVWFSLFRDGTGTYEQRQRFTAWYETDVLHQQAYAQVSFAHQEGFDFTDLLASLPETRSHTPSEPSAGLWQGLWEKVTVSPALASTAAALILLAVVSVLSFGADPEYREYRTTTAETNELLLDDGTKVTLGAKSILLVEDFTDSKRRVILASGEALFDVAHDKARPFTVASDGTEITVLGTRFNVNKAEKRLQVALLDGLVEVRSGLEDSILPSFLQKKEGALTLRPEQSVTVRGGNLEPVQAIERDTIATWVEGRLTYKQTPLRDVVADMQRYMDHPIRVADGALMNLPVTATFQVVDVETVLENFSHILPIEVRKTSTGGYILRRAW
ncbi:FecR family protein [Paremcibacter congregatus]|uniref:FecR family protein n=1 Tax=Paremcibacter congregatus TaxID=2043170 RepID=UPI003A922712